MKTLLSFAIFVPVLLAGNLLYGQTAGGSAIFTELRAKIADLESQLTENSSAQYERTIRARIAIDVSKQFINFARWDAANPGRLASAIGSWQPIQQSADGLAVGLPEKQVRECLAILNAASRQMTEPSQWPQRKSNFDANLSKAKLVDGHYFNDGRPMFPFGIFRAPDEVPATFGSLSLAYIHPKNLNRTRPRIGVEQIKWFNSQLDSKHRNGKDVYLFLGHEPPIWETGPTIRQGRTTFIEYNIDHTVVATWWNELLIGFGRSFFDHESALNVTMLANEPHWFTTETSWGTAQVSDETLWKFQLWLQEKHEGIATLNEKWETRYLRFSDIKFQTPLPAEKLQGAGFWFDWCRFNQSRAMEFFKSLDSSVRRIKPDSLNSLKIPSQLFLESQHDHGIDWFRIAKEFGMLGIDSTMTASSGIYAGTDTKSDALYSIDWVGSTAALDFLKSTCSDKLVFDSEWHGISSIHWRDPALPSEYVRTCLWLNHLSGMAMNQAWYWSRDRHGAPSKMNRDEFFGSILTQPAVLNAYLSTMAEINQYAEEVVQLARRKRNIGLLYCEAAAIQDPKYLAQFSEVYQSLKFTGLPIRIVCVQAIADFKNRTDRNNDSNLSDPLKGLNGLVIPPTRYIGNAHFLVLTNALLPSLKVIKIGSDNFLFDPYGKKRNNSATSAAFSNTINIDWSDSRTLHELLSKELHELIESSETVVDQNGTPIWGLLQFHKPGGEMKVFVNVSNHDIEIQLDGQQTKIQPMETRLVPIRQTSD